MRLIDADKLIHEVIMENAVLDADGLYHGYDYELSKGTIIDIINAQPTLNSLEQMLDYFEECRKAEPRDKDVSYICIYLNSLVNRMRKREKHLNDSKRVSGADQSNRNESSHTEG